MPGLVLTLGETPGAIRWPGSWRSRASDNREVDRDLLGLSDEQRAELARRGVI